MTRRAQFFVAGNPVTQGSKKGFVVKGKVRMVESAGKRHKDWRAVVHYSAQQQGMTFLGPVIVQLGFYLRRPKSHFGTGRNAGVLKKSAPQFCTKSIDIDKLCRSVLDSLTGSMIEDDCCVVELHANKWWESGDRQTGVNIVVESET